MTCNITSAPLYPEPLPLYRRDPETVSILSAAPSYVSDTPTYTSQRRSTDRVPGPPQPRGLPSARYAPGFHSPALGSLADIELQNYNITNWSSITSSHASRQYQNVARRRASQAVSTAALLQSLSAVPPSQSSSSAAASSSVSPTSSSVALNNAADSTPVSPFEDPSLVGEEAAQRARAQRLYREKCRRGEEALRHESKAWDFMLAQMADWEERQRSWGQFKTQVKRTKLLSRRIGLRK